MKETKHERFCRVVEKRMAELIDCFEKLGIIDYQYITGRTDRASLLCW